MTLTKLFVVIFAVALILWLVHRIIPMDGWLRTIITVVIVMLFVLWLLMAAGLLTGVNI